MARNLREKLHAVLQDGYDLKPETVVTRLEQLIKDELLLREEERSLTYSDITVIQSMAAREYTQMSMTEATVGKLAQDQAMIRTLCLVNAVVSFLRSRGLLYSLLRYKK